LAAGIAIAPVQPSWAIFGVGDVVFDPSNFAQNILTAARTLAMINNQVQQLQHEAQMLVNQAKNLQNLGFNSTQRLNQMLSRINQLMSQARGIAYTVTATEQAYQQYYPTVYQTLVSNNALAQDAKQRWLYSMEGYRQTMRVQAAVSESIGEDQALITELVTVSQGAAGALEAQQASNQLLALTAQQNAKTQQLMAAQYRSQALDAARHATSAEAARARFARFIGDGDAYTPN